MATLQITIIPNSIQVRNIKEFDYEGTHNENEPCFEAWIGDEQQNWCRNPPKGQSRIPERIPCCLFYGIKEGDKVVLLLKDRKYTVECRQLNTKWGDKNFEETLYDLSSSFGGVYSPMETYDPNQEQQKKLLILNHQKICAALGKPVKDPTKFRYFSC